MAQEQYVFGGTDSRSNPLNFPQDRSLYCLNWVPNAGGWLEFRKGYSPVAATGTAPGAFIHSIVAYEMWTGVRFLLIGSGTNLFSLNLSTGAWAEIGTAMSGNRLDFFAANGQVHIGDGVQVWFFDGTTLRKNGIRALTATEAASVGVAIGQTLGTLTTTTSFSAGGSWPSNDVTGEYVGIAAWDTVSGELSPLAILNNGAAVKGLTGQKLAISNTGLPALTGTQVWLPLITQDGGGAVTVAMVSARGSAHQPTALPAPNTCTVSGYTVTVASTAHGLTTGQPIAGFLRHQFLSVIKTYMSFGPTPVTVIDANHYSFVAPALPLVGSTIIAYQILTGQTILDRGFSTLIVLPAVPGLPASAVGGAQPGYQFYACIWDPVTQAVGNRMPIGGRLAPTVPSNVTIKNLPNLTAENPEFAILIGYTIDGGEIPYLAIDSGGNWLSLPAGTTSTVVDGRYALDLTSEMPYRNGLPPPMNKFCVIGDQALGCTGQDAYVYVSGSAANPLNPEVVGRPEQSWDPDDVVTFPTREVPTCIQEYNQSAMVMSRNYSSPLVNMQGVWDWGQGFPVGAAGQRAFTKSIHGPFWVTGKKELSTINTNWGAGYALATGPIIVSEEYERGLLAQIGDQYLGEVEVVPYLDVATQKDELIIKCRDANGVPFEIVHDFKLKDERAPMGQGYMRSYGGVLAADYTLAMGFDVNGVQRAYAGGGDGNLYLEESGYNDNGAEFSTDFIGIVNLGPEKPSISDLSLWGDRTIIDAAPLSISRFLDGSGPWEPMTPAQDKGDGDHDFKFHNRFKNGEMQFCYVRLRMQSHSVDAPATELSMPIPHFPVEDYGKIYMARVLSGAERGE